MGPTGEGTDVALISIGERLNAPAAAGDPLVEFEHVLVRVAADDPVQPQVERDRAGMTPRYLRQRRASRPLSTLTRSIAARADPWATIAA